MKIILFFAVCIGLSAQMKVSIIGDSRAAQVTQSSPNPSYPTQAGGVWLSTSNTHWLNIANDLGGHNLKIIGNYGISGYRSDQWVAYGQSILNDQSELAVISPGCANDIGQASSGYTTLAGVSVTLSNVATVCAGNITALASQLITANKKVVVMGEYASTSSSTSQIAALIYANELLRSYCLKTRGATYFDTAAIMWAPSSTTAIVYNTGYSTDGVHPNTLGCFYIGKALQVVLSNLGAPAINRLPDAQLEVNSNSPLCLMLTATVLFNTLTGGTKAGSGTITGNVPSGFTITAPLSTTSVTITSAADASGFGNDITLAITATAADTVTLTTSTSLTANVSPGDQLVESANISVASGSSGLGIPYLLLQYHSDQATVGSAFDLYPINIPVTGPTIAYVLQEVTNPYNATIVGGSAPSTVSSILPFIEIPIAASGSGSVTISRFDARKVL